MLSIAYIGGLNLAFRIITAFPSNLTHEDEVTDGLAMHISALPAWHPKIMGLHGQVRSLDYL